MICLAFWKRLLSPLGAICLLALGCTDPLAPSSAAGTYVLVRYDGAAMPATVPLSGPPSFFTVIADTLVLDREGRGSKVTVFEAEHIPGVIERESRSQSILVAERSGQLYVAFWPYLFCEGPDCRPDYSHLLTPVGRRLFLRLGNQVMEYEALAPAL
jgi:hypothetical protein